LLLVTVYINDVKFLTYTISVIFFF
jgi:hypothetical protein